LFNRTLGSSFILRLIQQPNFYKMKSLKTLLTAFALFAVATATNAQENTTITSSATVVADIVITPVANVNFGSIQDTGSPVLDPQGTNTADVGGSATFGKFSIAAANSTQLVIDWNQATVSLSNGTQTMTYTPDVSANSTDAIASSSDVTKNTAGAATETSAGGALFVYVGGNLGALSSQAAGTYTSAAGSGDLVFTINYQ
jgi:spore coat protein U-like protein